MNRQKQRTERQPPLRSHSVPNRCHDLKRNKNTRTKNRADETGATYSSIHQLAPQEVLLSVPNVGLHRPLQQAVCAAPQAGGSALCRRCNPPWVAGNPSPNSLRECCRPLPRKQECGPVCTPAFSDAVRKRKGLATCAAPMHLLGFYFVFALHQVARVQDKFVLL